MCHLNFLNLPHLHSIYILSEKLLYTHMASVYLYIVLTENVLLSWPSNIAAIVYLPEQS